MDQNTLTTIKAWLDSLDPSVHGWIGDYLNKKNKVIYIIDYRYASEFKPTAEQIEELGDMDTELMFIYDTINHNPVEVKPISVSNYGNELAKNGEFWKELMKGYSTRGREKSIIGPASGGFILLGPSSSEQNIVNILSKSDEVMGNIIKVNKVTIANHKVIHAVVDSDL